MHDHRGGPVCGPPPPRCVALARPRRRSRRPGGRPYRAACLLGTRTRQWDVSCTAVVSWGGVETIRIPRAKGCALPLPGEGNYYYYYYYLYPSPPGQAAGKKTRLDIQNYGCNGSLLRCGKKPHFLSAEPWKGVGKGMLSPGCLL